MPDIVRVADHAVSHPASQQLVHRHAEGLTLDVPQRDVDRRYGRGQDPLCGEKASTKEHLPDTLNLERIAIYEQRAKVVQRAHYRQFPTGEPGFADAIDPFVGVDDHEQEVPPPAPYRVWLNVGDLHIPSIVSSEG